MNSFNVYILSPFEPVSFKQKSDSRFQAYVLDLFRNIIERDSPIVRRSEIQIMHVMTTWLTARRVKPKKLQRRYSV